MASVKTKSRAGSDHATNGTPPAAPRSVVPSITKVVQSGVDVTFLWLMDQKCVNVRLVVMDGARWLEDPRSNLTKEWSVVLLGDGQVAACSITPKSHANDGSDESPDAEQLAFLRGIRNEMLRWMEDRDDIRHITMDHGANGASRLSVEFERDVRGAYYQTVDISIAESQY